MISKTDSILTLRPGKHIVAPPTGGAVFPIARRQSLATVVRGAGGDHGCLPGLESCAAPEGSRSPKNNFKNLPARKVLQLHLATRRSCAVTGKVPRSLGAT